VGIPGGTGYFDDIDPADKVDYSKWATGTRETFEDQVEAMLDYRVIKGGVARAGGLSNSIMSMCIAHVWSWKDRGAAEKMIRAVADVKHILCQDMLDAKHGGGDETDLEMLGNMFYRMGPTPYNTKEEYKEFMTRIGLPEEGVNFIVDVFFKHADPPENINETLKKVNPFFMLTRRQASLALLTKFCELSNSPETSLHSLFVCREKGTKDV
jgi:hypothetical protein